MRLYALILFFGVLTTINADPDPKKYKSDGKDKIKQSNTTLTSDEKKFLRDVEAKFGIKNDSPQEETEGDTINHGNIPDLKRFPAVIAIEIVNDTDTKTKGKRTIDANLGYGYKTNSGYTYSYFGKPSQEKGKFMIYPYSQEDITPGNVQSFQTVHHYEKSNGKHVKTSVEIQPSQAFELVPVKENKPGYDYNKPSIEFKTPTSSSPSHTSSFSSHPSTLYTTYNGEQFSGLSGQFPSVMSNYLVEPSQLLKNPEYQNIGLTQDHLRSSHIEQKVVPVLVLRIPSSSLTNPTAELYANIPQNYPHSNYLNHLNLQQLVNQYFQKIGYNTGPQVTTYSNPLSSISEDAVNSVSQYETQHYSHPQVQPSYTQSHSSGVQYSAVKPVMAKYPSSYTRQYYSPSEAQSLYKQSSLPHNYEYQYVPQSAVSSQSFYASSSNYPQQTEHGASQSGHESSAQTSSGQDQGTHVQYEVSASPAHVTTSYETSINHDTAYAAPQEQASPQVATGADYVVSQSHGNTGYETPHSHVQYHSSNSASSEYETPKGENSQSLSAGYESLVSSDESPKDSQAYYNSNTQQVQQETHSAYQPQDPQLTQADLSGYQYIYEHQQQLPDDQGLILAENYPSKDHTIATVLPAQYAINAVKQNPELVQTVSYVTPMPHSKYKIPYQVMVPQTYLKNPSTEKVTYVHSQSMAYNFMPSGGKHTPSRFRNYHSHPKRMINKHEKPHSRRPITKNKRSRHEKKTLS